MESKPSLSSISLYSDGISPTKNFISSMQPFPRYVVLHDVHNGTSIAYLLEKGIETMTNYA
jgi:hypothetical protein